MSDSIRHDALGVCVLVIFYSFLCFSASFLLAVTLLRTGNPWDFHLLCASFLSLSTFASIAQQIHYAVTWRTCKVAMWYQSQRLDEFPALKYVGVAEPFQLATYIIENYVYNVVATMVLFWAISLFMGMWDIKVKCLVGYERLASWFVKIFSIAGPAAFQGCLRLDAVKRSVLVYLVLNNVFLAISFTGGSLALLLTLYKYVQKRRRLASIQVSTDKSGQRSSIPNSRTARAEEKARRKEEQWLIIRFTIGFIILAAWEVCQVFYQILQANSHSKTKAAPTPDFSIKRAHGDIVEFIPGVTASLIYFIIFGTTAPLRKTYAQGLRSAWKAVSNGGRRSSCRLRSKVSKPPIVAKSSRAPPPPPILQDNSSQIELTLWPQARQQEMSSPKSFTGGYGWKRSPAASEIGVFETKVGGSHFV